MQIVYNPDNLTATVTKKSILTGAVNTRTIPVTRAQMEAWQSGLVIQTAMPLASPDDREFLLSGITPEEWNRTFGIEEEKK